MLAAFPFSSPTPQHTLPLAHSHDHPRQLDQALSNSILTASAFAT